MAFELIPAVDIHSGRVARLTGGRAASLEYLGDDPIALARAYANAGARWIHVVDLEVALGGTPANLEVIAHIAEMGVKVQAGGGLTEAGLRSAFAAGASRAVLGAAALGEPDLLERMVAEHGERLAIAVDVRGKYVLARGTLRRGPSLEVALVRVAAARPSLIVYTDVERDGALAGPDLRALVAAAEATGVPVLASGGVRSIRDVLAISSVAGVVGAIVGRALDEGSIDLAEAIRVLA